MQGAWVPETKGAQGAWVQRACETRKAKGARGCKRCPGNNGAKGMGGKVRWGRGGGGEKKRQLVCFTFEKEGGGGWELN